MATYATLTVPVADIIGANFNESRASVWIEPNTPVVLADKIRVGGRREQVINGVATFANLVTTNSADNPTSFGYRVTITAPPKGAAKREDIVTLTTSDFPFTATGSLKDIPEAWDNIALPAAWRSAFRDEMQAIQADVVDISNISTSDDVVEALVKGTAGAGPKTRSALSSQFASIAARPVSAYDHGVRGDGTDQTANLIAAFAASEAAGGGGIVELPPAVIDVHGSLSLNGYSSLPRGHGASNASGTGVRGTVLRGVAQTGPVLDLTGFRWPFNYVGRVQWGNFTIEGDGVANAANIGILMVGKTDLNGNTVTGGVAPEGFSLRDVTITNTGGRGFVAKDAYLSEIDALTVTDPVNGKATDSPYIHLIGCNGLRMSGLGLRCLIPSGETPTEGNVGPSGALLIEGSQYPMHDTKYDGLWLENLKLDTDCAIIVVRANRQVFADMQLFDSYKATGATGTSILRLEVESDGDIRGGNIVRGVIPGRGTTANAIDYGIDVEQSRNRIEGVKGYRGYNVRVASGVTGTYVDLGGAQSDASDPAWEDNSGNTTNTFIDRYLGIFKLGTRAGTATLPSNAVKDLSGSGEPEGNVTAPPGSIYRRTNTAVGLMLYTKQTGTGATGWVPIDLPNLVDLGAQTGNFALNCSSGTTFKVTLGAAVSLTSISNARTGMRLVVHVTQDATGSRTLAWPGVVKFAGGSAPTLSTAAGKVDVFSFSYDGTNWRETSRAIGT